MGLKPTTSPPPRAYKERRCHLNYTYTYIATAYLKTKICVITNLNGDEDFVSGEPNALSGSSYCHSQYHTPESKIR